MLLLRATTALLILWLSISLNYTELFEKIDDLAVSWNSVSKFIESGKMVKKLKNWNLNKCERGFFGYSEVNELIDTFVSQYPDIIKVRKSIGKSIENRSIVSIGLTSN